MTLVSLIAAMAENRVIGRDGGLPWHLPDDLRYFQRLTRGHPLIMGRRTFASVGKPLPGRRTIVLSHDSSFRPEGVEVVSDLPAALALVADAPEVFVAGGAEVYRTALPLADRLYLTVVHGRPEGDTRFPEFDSAEWTLIDDESHDADARHAFSFSFRRYERRAPNAPSGKSDKKTIA